MDQVQNEESQVTPKKKRKKKHYLRIGQFSIPVPAFLHRLGEDVRWYYDVRLWSPLILLLLILALLPGKSQKVETVEPAANVTVTEPQETFAATEPQAEPIIPEAAALAALADSVGAGRSENVKTIIMWVAVNRSEAGGSNGYGLGTLIEEIDRPNQWQGYDKNFPYEEATYEIAKEVLEIKKNNRLRPLDTDMLWFVLNDNGSISVRNQFTQTNARTWREKTVR